MAYPTWRFLSFSNTESEETWPRMTGGRMTRTQASHEAFCSVILSRRFTYVVLQWLLELCIMSASPDRRKGPRVCLTIDPALPCTHLIGQDLHTPMWTGANGILVGTVQEGEIIEYWELPISLCLLSFCLDAFPFLSFFFLLQNLLKQSCLGL